jgi:hypothetical protein
MSLLSFIRKPRARTSPHANRMGAPVSVTTPKAHRCVIDNERAPLEFNPDPELVMHIHKHKPTSGTSVPNPGRNLKLARAAAVADRFADYLEGNAPRPDLHEAIPALRLLADEARDGIVIGGAP